MPRQKQSPVPLQAKTMKIMKTGRQTRLPPGLVKDKAKGEVYECTG
jgi:hypothetical protein